MRILFIVPYAPTPIRTRSYNLLCRLARRGNKVTVATVWETGKEKEELDGLAKDGIKVVCAHLTKPRSAWNCLSVLLTPMPLQAAYCWQPELFERMQKALGSRQHPFDAIHVEHLRGARYGVALRKQLCLLPSAYRLPILWDSVDCISHLFEQAAHNSRSPFGRVVTRFELPRTRKYEAWLVNQFDRVLATSPIDAAALEALASGSRFQVPGGTQHVTPAYERTRKLNAASRNEQPAIGNHPTLNLQSPISVLPNGVDLDYFSPSDTPREPATIVFSGKMSYHANVTAALHLVHDIMPLVWKERPSVQVQIVGQDPPSRVRKLATSDVSPVREPVLSAAGGSPVTVTGRVADLRPYLQRATLAVAPMSYGAGIQNKVLEAMACATPVLATSQAVSALQVCSDVHVLIANEPTDFARQIVRSLDDRGLQRRIGEAGRRYVEQHHDWDGIVERLEKIYCELVE